MLWLRRLFRHEERPAVGRAAVPAWATEPTDEKPLWFKWDTDRLIPLPPVRPYVHPGPRQPQAPAGRFTLQDKRAREGRLHPHDDDVERRRS